MHSLKVDIRRNGPLARRTGSITPNDVYERGFRPVGRSREFFDGLKRVQGPVVSGVPTHMKAWDRWNG